MPRTTNPIPPQHNAQTKLPASFLSPLPPSLETLAALLKVSSLGLNVSALCLGVLKPEV
jgi:hypothetical protein